MNNNEKQKPFNNINTIPERVERTLQWAQWIVTGILLIQLTSQIVNHQWLSAIILGSILLGKHLWSVIRETTEITAHRRRNKMDGN